MTNAYTSIENAKDASPIPLSGTVAFHSRYNPVREAGAFASQTEQADFFIVLGLAGGYHVDSLTARFKTAVVIVVEQSDEDIAFLSAIPCVKTLLASPQVHIVSLENLKDTLLRYFRPAEHDKLSVLALRAWETAFPAEAKRARLFIQETLRTISADYSVQSHFGGIWQRNIFTNLRVYKNNAPHSISALPGKTAAVIAAGPSLDKSAEILSAARTRYYIIATDTAYQALKARGITADVCVSVDAQLVSHTHFFEASAQTLFVFDVSSPPAAIRAVSAIGSPVLLVETGHPLSQLASCFPHLETGSGTVTIAAASFAVQAGYTDIAFFGADFTYRDGKPYTKASYLDTLYNTRSFRTNPSEQQFASLMYRTELTAADNGMTTDLLTSYRNALAAFMQKNGYANTGDNCYHTEKNIHTLTTRQFDYDAFLQAFHQQIQNDATCLLPFAAWLKRKQPKSTYKEILSLAQSLSLLYTTNDES